MNSLNSKKIMNIGLAFLFLGIILPYLVSAEFGKNLSNLFMGLGLVVLIGGFFYSKSEKKPPQQ